MDDLLALLEPVIPKLSRSNQGRCLQYYGISKLSDLEAEEQKDLPSKSKFKLYELGFVHVDMTEFGLVHLLLYKQNPKLFKKNQNRHCVGLSI